MDGATSAAGEEALDAGGSLVVQTSFLGDMVLTTPLLAELARRGPVDVVATPASARLLANHPAVRLVHVYDKRHAGRGVGGLMALASRLRRARYSTAYLAQGSVRSAALALLAGIPRRVGFDSSAGRRLYTHRVRYRRDQHHAHRLWQLGAPETNAVPAEPGMLRPRLVPGAADVELAEKVLSEARSPAGPLVALAPGSAWAAKRWPFYPELARLLARHSGIIIIGGGDDAPLAGSIAAAVESDEGGTPVVDATGRLPLLASAALLERVDALVTNDSLPLHLASAADTPTVALFGATVPALGFGPLASRSITLGRRVLDCPSCEARGPLRCPRDHWRSAPDLEPAAVAAAVEGLLQFQPGD